MADDVFRTDEREWSDGVRNLTSATRYSTVTESLDAIFDLLCDPHRRYLLYYLFAVDGNVVEYEAAVNAVYKYEAAGTETNDHSREEVRIALHHDHLPRLADAGVLDYDQRQGTIRFTGDPALEKWVEHAQYEELE